MKRLGTIFQKKLQQVPSLYDLWQCCLTTLAGEKCGQGQDGGQHQDSRVDSCFHASSKTGGHNTEPLNQHCLQHYHVIL